MNLSNLEELGLTHNEARVYSALFDTGETKTGSLVKITSLHRVLIYDALESLIKKGLVTYVIKENRKYFRALSPDRLLDFLKEKENAAEKIIEQLKEKKAIAKKEQYVTIYEGIKGLKSALNSMLQELSPNGTHYVFASGNMEQAVGPYYTIYQQTKKRNKIKTFVLYDESFRKNKEIIKLTIGTIRFFPMTYFPTDTWIYNDKVLIVTYSAHPPIAVLIVNQETADSYKKFFDAFWKESKA